MQLVMERDLRYRGLLIIALAATGCAGDKTGSTYVVPQPINAGVQTASSVDYYPRETRVVSDSPAPKKRKKGSRTVKAKTVDAVTQYPFLENKVYDIVVTPGRLTSVYLEPGEQVIGGVAVGDPEPKGVHWAIDVTVDGNGGQASHVLLIRAVEPGLTTNAFVPTTKRTYHLDLKSVKQPAMDAVKFTYGTGSLPPLNVAGGGNGQSYAGNIMTASLGNTGLPAAGQQQFATQFSGGVDPSMLNTDYTIERESGRPRWKPVMAYDFGQNSTFIKFPSGTREFPVLFSEGGGPIPFSLANNGVMQTHVQIDTALLRLGDQAVRIMRGGY